MIKTTTPTKVLSKEHENILKVITALIEESDKLEKGGQIDKKFFEKAIDFIKNYADKFHHAKEEDLLFVEFNKVNSDLHCNPVEQMLYEHELGREFVKGMAESLITSNKENIIKNARGYADLLKEHIFKEDSILYPLVEEVFDKDTRIRLLKKFSDVETKKFSKNTINKYLLIAKEFEKR